MKTHKKLTKHLKWIVSALFLITLFPVNAQEETSTTESLDFTVGGINYTIVDQNQRTCITKAGVSYMDETIPKIYITYGNDITGEVTIPESVIYPGTEDAPLQYDVIGIGSYSFGKATSIKVTGNNLQTVDQAAFEGNVSLTSIELPESVNSIGSYAFAACSSLTSFIFPPQIIVIPNNIFTSSGLANVTIPESVISIGDNAFSNCKNLEEITIGQSVIQLGKSVFENCYKLKSLTIEEGITAIPSQAFDGCNSLTTLTIPSTVTSIADKAFDCPNLKEISYLGKNLPAISSNSFNSNNYSQATLNVYKTVYPNFKKSSLWGQFANISIIPVLATNIVVVPSSINLNSGLSSQLSTVLTPEDASDEVVWSIESATPSDCISLSETGKVTGRKVGTAVVKASCGSVSSESTVTVTANTSSYVRITPLTDDLFVGDVTTLTATVIPSTIIPNFVWKSSNPDVASVDISTGELTALSPGATIVTATNDNISGRLAITVNAIPVNNISLDKEAYELTVGQSFVLNATVTPANATYNTVTWDSNDQTVAVVSNGMVTAIGVGTANIRAMADGVTANCTVTVNPILVESIEISSSNETLKIGQSLQLGVVINPSNATDQKVVWSSSVNSVAIVSNTGEVTAIAPGETIITATCDGKTATRNITVEAIPSEDIVLNYTALNMKPGDVQQLTAVIYPLNTTDQTVYWSSYDERVATVLDGLVTAVAPGTTTINVTNDIITSSCTVTVEPIYAEQIILSANELSLPVGSEFLIQGYVLPENTTDGTILWQTLSEIVDITPNKYTEMPQNSAIITAIKVGTTVLKASCGPNAVNTCNITVYQPATSITLNESQLTLEVGEVFDLIETVTPSDATDPVVWNSEDVEVATIDENGIVTGVKPGETFVTATCGNRMAECKVKVIASTVKIEKLQDSKDGVYTVTNLQGVRIMVTKDKESLETLEPGIYIINNQKILIR